MSRRVTRRELLAGITAAGAAGTLSGVGTAALLVDRETLAASVASGRVELQIDIGSGPVDATGGPVSLPLPALEAGGSESTTFSLLVPEQAGANPVYLWLRAGCGAETTLGSFLRLTVSRADGAGETLFDGTLNAFLAAFEAGIPLDASGTAVEAGQQSCIHPGTEVELRVDYELSTGYIGDEEASVLLDAVAVQCRHVDAGTPPAAFAAPLGLADCAPACSCCTLVSKYEIENDRLVAGEYAFTEGSSAYRLTVADVVTNGDGEPIAAEFGVVLADDPGTQLERCRLLAKSARNVYEDTDSDGVVSTNGQSISHITVGICTAKVDGEDGPECPENLVRDPSLGNVDSPGDDDDAGGNGNGHGSGNSNGNGNAKGGR